MMDGSTRNRRRSVAFALGMGLVLAIAGGMVATIGTASGATSAAASRLVQASDATVAAKTFSIGPGKATGMAVSCPEGKRAVGGGVGQSQSISPSFGYIQQSGPESANVKSGDVARIWFAAVFNNSGAGVRTYWVFALCSATSTATIQVNPFTVGPSTVNGASVDCPAGKRALGGGLGNFDFLTPFDWVQSSGPVDETGTTANTSSGDVAEGWYASVYNFGATAREFRVYAICADDAESDATIQAKILSVAPGNVGEATVQCPVGKRIVGGGVGQTVALNTPRGYIQESGPVDETGRTTFTASGDVATAWRASVYNPPETGAPTREFRVFAICAGDTAATPSPPPASPPPATTPPAGASCGGNRATIVGSRGNDVLTGTLGRDVIVGLGGNDKINARGGNDLICGGDGKNNIVGGTGDDFVIGGGGADRILGGPGSDTLFGGAGGDWIDGGANDDQLFGGDGNDILRGGSGPDRVFGEGGDDHLLGGPGVDVLVGGPGQNAVKP